MTGIECQKITLEERFALVTGEGQGVGRWN